MSDGLFPPLPDPPAGQPAPRVSRGQAMRDRQAGRIGGGFHPLSLGGARIPLHPDVPRDPPPSRDDVREYPRCGACMFRQSVGGHARNHAKCLFGYKREELTPEERARRTGTYLETATHSVYMGPRYSASADSDVKAWWPACSDYSPKKGA